MRPATLVHRSLRYHWRTNLAAAAGVATAVAVLGGSLLVGESVRASLRRLALERLGRTSLAVESPHFFREGLADDLRARPAFAGFGGACPLVVLPATAAHGTNGRQATDVVLYGVDERFFAFHGQRVPERLEGRGVLLSEALGADLLAREGDDIVATITAPSEIPGSTLFGRRDEPGRRLRVQVKGVLGRERLGGFALRPSQQDVRAVFVPLRSIQRSLGLERRVNTLLVSEGTPAAAGPTADPQAALASLLAEVASLEDLGLRLRALPESGALALESASGLVDDALVGTASDLATTMGYEAWPVFAYLANAIRANGREVPYSLVAALGDEGLARLPGSPRLQDRDRNGPPIVLNEWAAADLGVRPGERIVLDYYLWREEGRLVTESAAFTLAAVVPITGLAADRNLVPEYPGIEKSLHLADWEPPFPVDLGRIRSKDEAYWERWHTTPKAFLELGDGQRRWGHRLGRVTSLRLGLRPGTDVDEARTRFDDALRPSLAREGRGLAVTPVRAEALAAARGATDFGEYFVYFSFFLVAAALLLAGLFFRLGVEGRLSQVGLLRAVGFTPRSLFRQFLGEGLAVSACAAPVGMLGAALYAALIVLGLRTVWVGAVGTRELRLAVSAGSVLVGAAGGVLAALLVLAWTLRGLLRRSPRALLAGSLQDWVPSPKRGRRLAPLALGVAAAGLLLGSRNGAVPAVVAFFGAGGLLLAAALLEIGAHLSGRPMSAAALSTLSGLGRRSATFRPGRSLLCIALVAGAAFLIVAVGAFRHDGQGDLRRPDSESGGYTLFATSLQPLHNDPQTRDGRAVLGLPEQGLEGVAMARFRSSPGEDASCLNLYRPRRPTVLGASPEFIRAGRFAFQASLAETPEERANPWRLLERDTAGGAIPVVADASSLEYVLHQRLGQEMPLGDTGVRVRFVAALRPGFFQGQVLTSERHFQAAFPGQEGYRFFLIAPPEGREAAVTELLESRLADFGYDVGETAARLAAYHRVENTYIATFQTLGALGLLLGTVGLATVLLRNALERQGELALLRAVGYRASDVRRMVLAENAVLLALGLATGGLSALVASGPALVQRGGGPPLVTLLALLLAVSATGIGTSLLAVAVINRLPLLKSLRSE